jgi:hypothetical protein
MYNLSLAAYLETMAPEKSFDIQERYTVLKLLAESWKTFRGSNDQSTTSDKLYRAENLTWTPPILSFFLERHGATVNGSSRAELHHWTVNISSGTAKIVKIGRRQLYPMDKRMDTLAVAKETARLIQSNTKHQTLNWVEDGVYVIVQIGKVIPLTNQQTTTYRRANYRAHLNSVMRDLGWVRAHKGSQMGFRNSAVSKDAMNTEMDDE